MHNRKRIKLSENPLLLLERIGLFRLWSFTKLNMKIHEKDPIFKKANLSDWSRFKFKINFSFKILCQNKYLVKENGNIAGALALEKKKISVFVYAVGLLDPYRRKGYGTKLMTFAEDFAKSIGKQFVNFSVLLDNTPAIKMYEKIGYRPQGLGLTLVRCFKNKLDEHFPSSQIKNDASFVLTKLKNPSKLDKSAIKWWMEEIKEISKEAEFLTISENLLDFESKTDWKGYEISQQGKTLGMIAILPFAFLPTFVIFSYPEKTWNLEWTTQLISYLEKSINLENTNSDRNIAEFKNFKTIKATIFQIFLTHQHRNALKKEEEIYKNAFVEDTIEDRQIYFKKVKY